MDLKNSADQRSPCRGERYIGDPAIVWARLPTNEALDLQSVDRGGNRTTGEHYLPSDRIDRKRPFVQENFQDGKIRETESGIGYTSRVHLSEGSISFHENQPEMDAGNVDLAGISFAHGIIFTSR